MRRRDGRTVPVNVSVSVVSRDAEGRIAESNLILHDMTRRKAAETALKISQARYQDRYHNAPDMFASLDPSSHRIVQCNKTLARVTGVDRTELIERSLLRFWRPNRMRRCVPRSSKPASSATSAIFICDRSAMGSSFAAQMRRRWSRCGRSPH